MQARYHPACVARFPGGLSVTFSITARCPETGAFGVAVSTKLMCVGALCPFVAAGTGAISTQSFVNPYIGIDGLVLLGEGVDAETARDRLAAADPGREQRQFAIVDREGRAAAWSGAECVDWFGHEVGDGFAAAGNMLTGPEVISAMAAAFRASAGESLGERLVRALEAGQAAGGDRRGRQSAALRIAVAEAYPLTDLRIDDHPDPVAELRRLWMMWQTDLGPLMDMLPTRDAPGGRFDLAAIREHLPGER
jgi:uncharacterized Ntn-hydrolase superfamily protein